MTHDTRYPLRVARRGDTLTPRLPSDHRDGIARLLAPRLHATPITVEHQLREVNERAAALLAGLLDVGAVERAARFYAPILAAWERIKPLPVREVMPCAQQADANDEPAETAYLLNPCKDTRRAFIQRTERQLITTLQLLVSLKHEDATDVAALT